LYFIGQDESNIYLQASICHSKIRSDTEQLNATRPFNNMKAPVTGKPNINSRAYSIHTLHRCRLFYRQINKKQCQISRSLSTRKKKMKTLKKTVVASGFEHVLSGKGTFTVFAPTDTAFNKLDKSVMANLLKPENKTKLIDLVNHHVVAGKINFIDLKDGEKLKTVDGKP
jgi:uncharacterized surface protein with fasciclin (FAS1) repeats